MIFKYENGDVFVHKGTGQWNKDSTFGDFGLIGQNVSWCTVGHNFAIMLFDGEFDDSHLQILDIWFNDNVKGQTDLNYVIKQTCRVFESIQNEPNPVLSVLTMFMPNEKVQTNQLLGVKNDLGKDRLSEFFPCCFESPPYLEILGAGKLCSGFDPVKYKYVSYSIRCQIRTLMTCLTIFKCRHGIFCRNTSVLKLFKHLID